MDDVGLKGIEIVLMIHVDLKWTDVNKKRIGSPKKGRCHVKGMLCQ
jgi:hypothetical protein